MAVLIITAFYAVLTFILTFPLAFKINHAIPGFFSTDEPSIWYYWWLKYSHLHKIDSKFSDLLAFPFGVDLSGIERIFPFGVAIKKILVYLTNEFCAYNIELLSTFALAGLFAYLLVRYVTRDRWVAVFSGIAYSFCPYHFARAWQHSNLAQIQWFPLLLLGLLRLLENKKIRINFLVIISTFAIFSYDFYYIYFSFIIIALFTAFTFFMVQESIKHFPITTSENRLKLSPITPTADSADHAYGGSRQRREGDFLEKSKGWNFLFINICLNSFLGIIAPLLCSLSFLFQLISNSGKTADAWNIAMRPFQDLFSQSARPLSYFLPSTEHPIFGSITQSFVGSKLYGTSFTEHALYLGWTPLLLAFLAFRRWRKMRKVGTVPFGDSPYYKENFYIGFFIFLAIVAWFFSQPPWWNIFGFKVYMPSFFIYKILPVFRAYCRFGIVVMLSVAVLAGFGLKFILEKFKTQKSKVAIACLFSCLVLFEFWNWPPYKVIDFSKVPAVYYWLKEEPGDFSIAEYPLDADSPSEMYKFYQTKHEKKIINGTIPGTHANKVAQTIRKLSRPQTSRVLKWMGVKYVLVHRQDYIDTGLVGDSEELNKIPQNSGLKFIKSFSIQECPKKDIMCIQKTGQIDVYEVVAVEPIEPKVEK